MGLDIGVLRQQTLECGDEAWAKRETLRNELALVEEELHTCRRVLNAASSVEGFFDGSIVSDLFDHPWTRKPDEEDNSHAL